MKQPGRLTRFQQSLPAQAAIVTSNLNRYYLSGFLGTAGTLLVTKDKVFYLADGRYFEAVSQKVPFAKAVLVKSKGWDELAALCAELGIGQLAFEDLEMTVASYRALEMRCRARGPSRMSRSSRSFKKPSPLPTGPIRSCSTLSVQGSRSGRWHTVWRS